MRLVWLCNMMPGVVQEKRKGNASGGLWVDHVLTDLRKQEDLSLHIFCPDSREEAEALDDRLSYETFQTKLPGRYLPELEARFRTRIRELSPDVIHIWGTEFAHTLAMVNACEALGLLDRVVVSIQGLCSVYAPHYAEGVPHSVQKRFTFRDFLKQDNILQQQRSFAVRGDLEEKALRKVRHVIGRTDWDLACTSQINPEAAYHFCNETLRESFYEGQWQYDTCCRHRIFTSSCVYPIKGFHYLLEAFAEVRRVYPDAVLAVPGSSPVSDGIARKLRRSSYQKYLAELMEKHGLTGNVEFLGRLTADAMKEQYLKANVFVLPSTIENSPNSLGEAMLLGVPCVAADVGGVTTMLTHRQEGYVYQSTAPYMLAHYIKAVFAREDEAKELGQAARAHALQTHDPHRNLQELLSVYRTLAK